MIVLLEVFWVLPTAPRPHRLIPPSIRCYPPPIPPIASISEPQRGTILAKATVRWSFESNSTDVDRFYFMLLLFFRSLMKLFSNLICSDFREVLYYQEFCAYFCNGIYVCYNVITYCYVLYRESLLIALE